MELRIHENKLSMKAKLLLIALLAQFCSLTTMAYDACIDGIYYEFSGSNATVVSEDVPYSGSIVIPQYVTYNGKTYEVTEIGNYVFNEQRSILSVSIPESVIRIGDYAFHNCHCQTAISIPNNVSYIGSGAFWDCNVCSVPESVTTIGEYAFEGTSWLNNQPDGLVYIGKVAYKYKGTIPENTTIEIKEGTLAIADYAFKNCSGLTSISFPESITSIGYEAFEGTEWFENQSDGLVYIGKVAYKFKGTMPENTTIEVKEGTLAIADYAFSSCNNLNSVILPEGLTFIGKLAFAGCQNLSSITIPESVTTIGNNAFRSCQRLSSIVIPENVTTICDETFRSCYNLSSVTIPEGVTSIGNDAFASCWTLYSITIPESVTSIGNSAFEGCINLSSITIPENVTSVGNYAFKDCKLSSITIPASATSIGDNAFLCHSLSSIVVEDGNTIYDSRNGCNALIETATNTLKIGCKNTIIPEDVTSIGNYAFQYCTSLTDITIPENITNIGNHAFEGCNNLVSITFPESITSIGTGAFERTAWFENLPDGLIYVGKVAFRYKGTMPENTSIDIKDGTLCIASEAFKDCNGLTSINIPESVTRIGWFAFGWCSSLTSIAIPKGLTNIDDYVFCQCHSLTSIIIPENVVSIGDFAFSGCQLLSSIIIPEGVTTIGHYALHDCCNLKSVVIPSSVTSIGRCAFDTDYNFSLIKVGMLKPVPIFKDTFGRSDTFEMSETKLYVPKGCKEAYQSAEYWKDFKDIIECDYVDATDQTIAVCGSTTMEIDINNFDTDLVAFQMDLTLPEGVSLDKTGCSLSSRITDEEQELAIGKLENGAYRLTSSSLSLTPISGNDGTLLTLKLTATLDSDDGQATISNIRFSTAESKRIDMDDVSFNIDIVHEFKLAYKVDGEVYKTYTIEYGTALTAEAEPTKEGYTFSGWNGLPDIMHAHDVEVTGSFTINNYKLTYMVDNVEYKSYEIDYATAITPEAAPGKEGYTFSAWIGLPETMPAHDVEVTGAFTVNSYTLTYLVDGEVYKASSVVYGTELVLEAEPTKDGYTFGGWSELPETMPAHDVEVTGRFYLFGDVNTDEEVDVVDVVDVARFVVATPSEKFREKLADLNYDNTVNLGDAVVLVNHIAGDQNFVREMVASEQNTSTGILSLTRNGKAFALNLTNGQAFTAFQFDLYVAEDVDVVQMKLNSKRQQKHQLLYNKVEDGHYRVAALSTSNDTFQGTAGELLSIVMDDALDADVEISNIHFFDTKGNDYAFDTIGVDQETGVNNVNGNNNVNDNIYDLQGRKLSRLQRGVNIIGGKKVIVK